jgi:hypothetical protein
LKKTIFLLLTVLTSNTCAQITFDDIKGVWNTIETLNIVVNEDGQPLRIIADSVIYLAWPSSILIQKKNHPNFQIHANGGYDVITNSYLSNNMLILEVENKDSKTKGKIGVNFINKDKIYFTIVAGKVDTPIYFGRENIYIRAPIISSEK